MPEQVQPFTKRYRASAAVPGYARVTASTQVVVTGSRFISDSERVPFPQSRPLMVCFQHFERLRVRRRGKRVVECVRVCVPTRVRLSALP